MLNRVLKFVSVLLVGLSIIPTVSAQEFTISGGGRFSVALCGNGQLYSWGSNDQGQLGLGSTGGTFPLPQLVSFPGAVQILQADAGSGSHALALDCNKNVWAWGINCDGQVGNGAGGRTRAQVQANTNCSATNFVNAPTKVLRGEQTVADGWDGSLYLSNVKFISGGNVASYAIVGPNNALMAWGSNVGIEFGSGGAQGWYTAGLLGRAGMDFSNTPVYVRKCDGTPLTNVVSVDASDMGVVALTASGEVFSFGLNTNSSLGIGTDFGGTQFSTCATPVKVGNATTNLTGIVQITGGDQHFLAISNDGTVYSWGGAWAGQTGVNNGGNINWAQPVLPGNSTAITGSAAALTMATAVSASQIGSAVVVTDPGAAGGQQGYLYTFGGCGTYREGAEASNANLGGQLGLGHSTTCTDGTTQMVPKLVETYYNGATPINYTNINVVGVSDGDGVFYIITQNKTTLVRSIYVMGANNRGQLGIGGTTAQAYPTLLTTLPCTIADPCPIADLGGDRIVCPAPAAVSELLRATSSPATSYNYTWYKDGVVIPAATAVTYTATAIGTYVVSITRTGGGCTTCPVARDTVVIAYDEVPVIDLKEWCGNNGYVRLIPTTSAPSANYDWYSAATSGTKLGTSSGVDPDGDTLNVSTITANGSNQKTVYFEKKSQGSGTVFRQTESCEPTFFGSQDGINTGTVGNANNYQTRFHTDNTINITELSFMLKSELYNTGESHTAQVNFIIVGSQMNNGASVANPAIVYGTLSSATFTRTRTAAETQTITYKLNAVGNVTVPAGDFFIYPSTSTKTGNGNVYIGRGGNCAQGNTTVTAGGVTVRRTGMSQNSANNQTGTNNTPGYIFDVDFYVPAPVCPRIPVLLDFVCPCNKPVTITARAKATSNDTLCVGSTLTLEKNVIDTTGRPSTLGGYYYYWAKRTNGVYTKLTTTQKLNNPAGAYADYNKATTVLTDSGTYYLVIQDGPGNSPCKDSAAVKVVINAAVTPGTISANKTICTGSTPTALTGTASTGGITAKAYKWESSTTSTSAGFTSIGAYSAATGYAPGALTQTTYFRRRDSSGVCSPQYSNVITITVDPRVTKGDISAHDTICSGTVPAQLTGAVAAGGSGTATATYQWQSASAAAGPWANVTGGTGATAQNYTPPALTTTTYFRRMDTKGVCPAVASDSVIIYVSPAFNAGTIANAATTICYNTTPSAFTSSADASGGLGTGTYSYQWQESTDGTTWTNIAGETNATYTPSAALTATKYYRRRAISKLSTDATALSCNDKFSASIQITVLSDLTAGAIASALTTVCNGATASFTSSTAAGGGQTPYTYVWQYSTDGGSNYTNYATSNTVGPFTTPALSNTTTSPITILVRREVTSSGSCGSKQTAAISITVNPTLVPDITIAANNTTICNGENINFTSTPTNPGTSPTYQWQKNGVNISSANSATYSTTTAATGDQYRLIMTSNATCANPTKDTSNVITITVTPVATPEVTLSADKTTICSGETVTFTATPTNGGGTSPSYEFFVGGVSQGASSTVAILPLTITTTGTVVSVTMTSSSTCASPTTDSDSKTITVTPAVTPSVALAANPGTSICSGQTVSFTATPTSGGTAPTYVWKIDGATQAGQTSTTFSPTTIGNNNVVSVEMTVTQVSGTYCPSLNPATAQVTMTVSPPVTAGTIGGGTTICSGTSPGVLNETAPATGGSGTYTYKWQSSPDNSAWTDITPAATSSTYTPPSLLATTYYRRVDGSGSCATANTNSVTITVLPGMTPGAISIATSSICYNTVPGVISTTTPPGGGTGTYTITWEENTGSTWGPATGTGTNTTYTFAGPITSDIQIRKVINDGSTGGCNISYTTPVSITVAAPFTAGAIGSDQTVCSGATITPLAETTAAAGGLGAYTYSWQSSTDGGATWPTTIIGATGTGYNPGSLTQTTYFRRLVSNTCGSNVESSVVTITVLTNIPVSISIPPSVSGCANSAITVVSSANGAGTTPTYVWEVNGIVQSGAISADFTSSTLQQGDKIKVTLISSEQCKIGSPATSQESIVNITPALTPNVSIISNPICDDPGVGIFQATVSGYNGIPDYSWYRNGVPVGSNQDIYIDGPFTNGEQIRVVISNLPACSTIPSDDATTTAVVVPTPDPSIVESDAIICSGQSVTYTAVFTTGNTLNWLRNGTLINGQTGSTITVTQPGIYSVQESNGTCAVTFQDAVIVNVIPTPIANAGPDQVVLENDLVSLNGSGGTLYSWSPATGLSDATISNPTFAAVQTITYTLTVSDATNTCSTSDDVTITVERPIKVPNAITVNRDGQNDDWDIENISSFPNCIVEVYNRWGTLVWKSVGYDKRWDGTNYRNGEVLPDGTYFYIIILNSTKFPDPYKGYIQVIK